MGIRLRGNRILVEPLLPKKQIGDIHVPDRRELPTGYGKVLAVGEGPMTEDQRHVELPVEVDQTILYKKILAQPWPGDSKLQLLIGEAIDVVLLADAPVPVNDRILIHWNEITIALPRHFILLKNLRHEKNKISRGDDLQSRMHDIVSNVKLYTPRMESEDSSNRTVLIIPNAL
jgi:co-chaperonin GroES (HSP10)